MREWHVEEPTFYCDLLAGQVSKLDLWETEYFQVMPSAEAIVEWYRGTGLRPYLDRLTDDARREQFLAAYLEQIRQRYPTRRDGSVAFPFRRFVYRGVSIAQPRDVTRPATKSRAWGVDGALLFAGLRVMTTQGAAVAGLRLTVGTLGP